jgi:hypothetical protein
VIAQIAKDSGIPVAALKEVLINAEHAGTRGIAMLAVAASEEIPDE